MIESYPLYWPEGWKRTPSAQRVYGHFNKKERQYSSTPGIPSWDRKRDLTVADGVQRILDQLGKMGVEKQDVIISTNVRTRLDGMPRSGEREPEDPGAAAYWQFPGEPTRCMAVDRYTTVADNLAAIAATLDAMRAIERHGGAEILNRTFKGFAALPEKASSPWREILGFGPEVPIDTDTLDSRFRELVQQHHPDRGGDPEKFQSVIEARSQARKELLLPEVCR
jgi:hypothetical protein